MSGLTTKQQNELVVETLDLVGQIVGQVAARYPRHVDRSELWNAGALGLVEASRRYDPDSGVPFARYAAIRVRGAIIDSTRVRDWASRSVRRRLREVQTAQTSIEQQQSRSATNEEIARLLGIGQDELVSRQAHATTSTLLRLDQPSEGGDTPLADRVEEERPDVLPDMALEQRELRGSLVEAVCNLPAVQAEVISRHYIDGQLLQDIADDLGLTEARVSQIRSEAVMAMRSFFSTLYEAVEAAPDAAPGRRARAAYVSRMAERSTWRTRLDAEPLLREATGGSYHHGLV